MKPPKTNVSQNLFFGVNLFDQSEIVIPKEFH